MTTIPAQVLVPVDDRPMGAAEVLQLAILGGVAPGPVEIEDLILLTQSLGGGFWSPTVDVITTCLQTLETQRFVSIQSPPVPAADTVVYLSDIGADHLANLLNRDNAGVPEPLYHCLLGIKIALLDVLPQIDRQHQITIMVNRLKQVRDTIRGKVNRCSRQHHHLRNVIGFEENRIDNEIKWLMDLRDAGPQPAFSG